MLAPLLRMKASVNSLIPDCRCTSARSSSEVMLISMYGAKVLDPPPAVPLPVVIVMEGPGAEVPAESVASTVNEQDVCGDKPATVNVVPAVVPADRPSFRIVYCVTAQFAGTPAAGQLSTVLLPVVPEAESPTGTLGTTEQTAHVPLAVQGCPLPGPPLLAAGFCACVHQLAT